MITFHSVPDSNIVEFTIDGGVSRAEFDNLIAEINSKIEEHGSVDVLEEIRGIGKIAPSVIWADLRWAAGHWKNIGRAAVVCDQDWIENVVEIMQPLVSADVRHFDLDEKNEARAWLLGRAA
jgi:SpoIIAA-like